jgi:hypothetical protein
MKRLSLIVLFSFTACSVSESEVQEEWDEFVSQNNSCETVDDCVMLWPGCPLGCGSAVSADAEVQAKSLAESLLDRYERGGQSCDYDCAELVLACEDQTCQAVAPDTGS